MSCGRPLHGVEVAIVDPASCASLPEGRIGEIWTSGASTCRGYWNDPERSRDVFGAVRIDDPDRERRYLRTGDLGFLHEGELFVCGRIKDLIIMRGVNYYPQDIEAIAEAASSKLRPGCVAAFDAPAEDGERLIVAAEVKTSKDLPDPAEIARAIRARYYVEPDTILLVPHGAVPKTTSGKLSRSAARQAWLDGTLPVLTSYSGAREGPVSEEPAGLRRGFGISSSCTT
jgi:acyl-CoA synthetase (AMP-forming)/AMP-acid ligase II